MHFGESCSLTLSTPWHLSRSVVVNLLLVGLWLSTLILLVASMALLTTLLFLFFLFRLVGGLDVLNRWLSAWLWHVLDLFNLVRWSEALEVVGDDLLLAWHE